MNNEVSYSQEIDRNPTISVEVELQNIDPLYIIYPAVVVAFSFGLVIYWHYKRSLSKWVIVYSLLAYAGAIALKYAVQIPTLARFESAVGSSPFALGLYYGAQTVFFEVGGAYVVARYATSKGRVKQSDAEGYGLSLAFWENGVLIGLLTLINFVSYYAILSSGTSQVSQLVYDTLVKNEPGLFNPPSSALVSVGFDILERVSSLLAHFSWGYLCVMSAVFKRKLFFFVALPMGLIDFLVPFVSSLGIARFELLIFCLSLLCLLVALALTRKIRKRVSTPNVATQDARDSTLNPKF